jgi:hypothetical protein
MLVRLFSHLRGRLLQCVAVLGEPVFTDTACVFHALGAQNLAHERGQINSAHPTLTWSLSGAVLEAFLL